MQKTLVTVWWRAGETWIENISLTERERAERDAFNIVEEDDFEMHLRQVHGIKELNFPFEFYYYLYFSFLPSMPSR